MSPLRSSWLAVVALALGCASSGNAPPSPSSNGPAAHDSTPEKPAMPATNDIVSLSCTTAIVDGPVIVRLEAVNRSARAVHVLQSPRLPYLLLDGARVTVLHGVNDPDPEMDYYGIEIPLTRPLAPGEHLVVETQLVPLIPRHHYERKTAPVAVPAEIEVVCRLAYGDTAIDAAARSKMSINQLLAWQHWVEAPALRLATR
jgi:hypothetical protein